MALFTLSLSWFLVNWSQDQILLKPPHRHSSNFYFFSLFWGPDLTYNFVPLLLNQLTFLWLCHLSHLTKFMSSQCHIIAKRTTTTTPQLTFILLQTGCKVQGSIYVNGFCCAPEHQYDARVYISLLLWDGYLLASCCNPTVSNTILFPDLLFV